MLSANKAEAGKHGRGDAQANRLSHDAVKLLKSQDAGYLRVVAGKGRREIDRLEEQVGMTMSQGRGKKVLFVDDDASPASMKERVGKRSKLDTDPAGDGASEDERECSSAGAENVAPAFDMAGDTDAIEAPAIKSTAHSSKKRLATERHTLRDLRAARKRRKRLTELRVAKLDALKKRQREIMAAADQLELQRAKMARTVGGVNKDGVKWKIRERKR
jgi:U3 small nucleolar RNA-associated protein 11